MSSQQLNDMTHREFNVITVTHVKEVDMWLTYVM